MIQEDHLFEKWFALYPKLKPIVDLYSSMFSYPQMPIEMIFLNAVQALETYHARFICNDLKKYKAIAEKIIEQRPVEEQEQHRKQFLSMTQMDKNKNYIILKSRLCELFICNFKFEFSDIYNEKFPYAMIDSIVDTRHYFTHYSPTKEKKALSGKKLNQAVRIMRLVLEFYILKEIGFSMDYIKKVIEKRQGLIRMQIKRDKGKYATLNNSYVT